MMNEYPDEILKSKVRGLELIICGVHHGESFFQEHEELYDELISNSIGVVHQYPPVESDLPIAT